MNEINPIAKLPSDVLLKYINTFYGYGKWESNFWFIGIEEGGGNEVGDVQKRLDSWLSLGSTDLLDCQQMHRARGSITDSNYQKLHSRTWTRLILTRLWFESGSFDMDDVLRIQQTDWGGFKSNNLLVELFPLPSPGLNNWGYGEGGWVDLDSELSFLNDRKIYRAKLSDGRVSHIKSKIAEHKPKVVLFYGKTMQHYWDEIIGTTDLKEENVLGKNNIRFIIKDNTLFVQCAQPTYIRGYAFWKALGERIRHLAMEL